MKANKTVLWWVRNDLRIHDNAILHSLGSAKDTRFLPVFIWDNFFLDESRCSQVRQNWLLRSLNVLQGSLESLGSNLHFVRGPTVATLDALVKATGATEIYASAEQTFEETRMEAQVSKISTLRLFQTRTLFEPTEELKKKLPYSYSRFRFKIVPTLPQISAPLDAPNRLPSIPESFSCAPTPKPDKKSSVADKRSALRDLQPGETGALNRLVFSILRFRVFSVLTISGSLGRLSDDARIQISQDAQWNEWLELLYEMVRLFGRWISFAAAGVGASASCCDGAQGARKPQAGALVAGILPSISCQRKCPLLQLGIVSWSKIAGARGKRC